MALPTYWVHHVDGRNDRLPGTVSCRPLGPAWPGLVRIALRLGCQKGGQLFCVEFGETRGTMAASFGARRDEEKVSVFQRFEGIHERAPIGSEFARGWTVILAASIGVGLGITGVPIYAIGQFVRPLAASFGWSRAAVVGGLTVLTACSVLMARLWAS